MHLSVRFSTEKELKQFQDLLYEKSGQGVSFTGLLEAMVSEVTIVTAVHNIKSNKGSKTAGVDRMKMDKYLQMPKEELFQLIQSNISNYKPKPAKRKYIEKANGKKRPLGIPTVLDRIIQECMRLILEPICEARFYPHSYGFRPYRAQKHAIRDIVNVINASVKSKDQPVWAVEGDIKGCFDNINHRLLLKKLWRIGIHDKRVLKIISQMLKAGYIDQDLYHATEMGTPQGGILSPLLSNVYLNDFDWYVGRCYKEANIILTQHVRLGMDGYITQRNMNILVVGGSGSGKTRFFCKPGVYSANCSYLITDPKGELLRASGGLLKNKGYDVKVFNLIDPSQSDCYNPFVYVHNEKDVLTLIDNLIKNTTPRNASSNDPFWEKAEIALDSALMLYLISEAPPEERNFETMLYMMNFAEVREDDDQYRSPLDMLFRALEEEQPNHVAVKQYKVFKQAAGKTAKSILVSAAVRLAAFNIPQYARMTMADEMDFGSLGEKKRAIFCVIPIADTSMNYLVGMLYTQCFQELYHRADEKHGGRLPVPVRVIQDEWANVAQPESYPKILATCRSYNIGLNIIVQNIQNIKALYEKEWESIIGNCDTLLFLGGGNEPTSLEFVVKLLGKETLATRTRGQTKGRNGSSSTNFQQTGRELMTLDEVRKLGTNQAILFIRGESPVLDEKYNIKNHPNIRLTVDGKAKPYVHKPQGAPNYALPDLPYEFKSLDDYEFINMEESEHEETEKEDDAES